MTDLVPKVAEEGVMAELDPEERLIVLEDEVATECREALAAGLDWTPWRKRRWGERWQWCDCYWHVDSHKRKEIGIFISYSSAHRSNMVICERCLRRTKGVPPGEIKGRYHTARFHVSGHAR